MITYGELFAGVSGMGQGFDLAGMLGRWRVEIDRAAAGVLAFHHPDDALHADVVAFAKWLSRTKKHDPERLKRYAVSVIGGGSPCQDLSVAGLRAGLDGERSGLFRVMVRICRILRPRYVVWENVLGALSSNEGRDFAAVIGAFTGCVPSVPDDGWGYGGFAKAASPGRWNVAWRVFDSEYFGVPQRRYRVFLVASAGDGSCAEILFEPESVRGDSAPSREAREGVAGTLSARTNGGGGLGTDMELAGGVIAADVAPTLNAAFGEKLGLENQHIDRGGACLLPATAHALTTKNQRNDFETETLLPTRQGGFFDDRLAIPILEAGARTGKSTTDARCGIGIGADGDPMFTLQSSKQHAVAFSCKDYGADAGEVAPTLRSMGHKDSHANAGGQVAVAFNWQAAGNQTSLNATDTAATLSKSTTQAVAFNLRGRDGGAMPEECDALSVRAASGGSSKSYVATTGVRRLTPRECERLQGWPDDWTRWRFNVRRVGNTWIAKNRTPVQQADGPRYKQCGNGVTRNVAEWIALRVVRYSKSEAAA